MIKDITVTVDDLTGCEIHGFGWELRRISGKGEPLHFASLSTLAEALVTMASIFGLIDDDFLAEKLVEKFDV
jgi:hypothetical protein